MTTLGRHPDALAVKLTLGDGAHLVASTVNGWAGPVTLHYGPKTGDPVISDVGTVDGDEVSWTLTEAEVTARAEHDWARLEDNGVTLAAGPVMTWLGGLGSTTTQTIASLTAGPPGPTAVSTDADNVAGLGSDGLIYVSPADAGGFSDAAVAAFVADEDSDTYASITALQPDLSGYVETTDARLSDARTPTTHATSHASGGSDPVTPASIGAATPAQVSSGDTATLSAAQSHAQGLVDALTAASPATLDTLAEIAAALGEDPNFAATITTALANRVRFDAAQSLTVGEQAQARSNIGAGTSSFSGDYGDLDNKPNLGDAAAKDTGTTAGTVAAGDDSRITGAIPSGLIDAKGDLIIGTADNTVTRLPASTDGHVLTLDSAESAGVKWAAPSGGGGSVEPTTPYPSGYWHRTVGQRDVSLLSQFIRCIPLAIEDDITIDRVGVDVTAVGAPGSIARLGLYRYNRGTGAFDLHLDAGTVATDTTGPKEITVSASIPRGAYLAAIVGKSSGTHGTVIGLVRVNLDIGGSTFSGMVSLSNAGASAPRAMIAGSHDAATAFPGTLPATGNELNNPPALFFRVA